MTNPSSPAAPPGDSTPPRPWAGRPAGRRAVAALMVLLVIAITMATSYAVIRSQGTAMMVQANAGLSFSARQAAATGLSVAIKTMQSGSWQGSTQTLTGLLGPHQGYSIRYQPGDPTLLPTDPQYDDLPYRVTVLSTGWVAEPGSIQRRSTHQIRAVLRLIPRQLSVEPSDWEKMRPYTVYQTGEMKKGFALELPTRLQGRVRVQKKLELASSYPNDAKAWWYYLQGLNDMRLAGYPDWRPLTGPVDLPLDKQDAGVLEALSGALSVATNHLPFDLNAADWTLPPAALSYSIYPGGPSYTIPRVNSILANVSLGPDPATNPLGIYLAAGSVTLMDNVTIRGMLQVTDNVIFDGQNIFIQPADLPAVHPNTTPVRLPSLICNKATARAGSSTQITGLVAVFDKLKIETGPATDAFAINGRLLARGIDVQFRTPWAAVDWKKQVNDFLAQLTDPVPVPYFPVWMGNQGIDPVPQIMVIPEASAVDDHWYDSYNPIYVPRDGDASALDPQNPGLRWDLVSWTDSP